jgi:hypothetical protein
MTTAKGYVNWCGSNDFHGKKLWSFRLKNEEKWFNTGEMDPNIAKGELVEFNYDVNNGRYVVDLPSLVHINVGTAVSTNGVSTGRMAKRGNKDDYWDERLARDIENDEYKRQNDSRIQYQSARNAAITVVDILLREKALKVPEKNAYDVIMGKLKDLTNSFYDETSTFSEIEQENKEAV